MKVYSSFIIFLILISCNSKETSSSDKTLHTGHVSTENNKIEIGDLTDSIVSTNKVETVEDYFEVKTLFDESFGYGYQILNNGKLYINQKHIPAIQGNIGFETEEKAQKTAEYIVYKLNNGLFPPTVTPQELDSLGVL